MSVTLHTTHGDIKVEIFCEAVPKTAENFLALCATGAYDDTPFHRLMPGFMVQGGDISQSPSLDSVSLPFPTSSIPKGGCSIYHPSPLEQEIHLPSLRHNTRGILSMAAKNQKTPTGAVVPVNGSQFFITFAPAPHLDGQSTVFGKVLGLSGEKGAIDVLSRLESAKVKVDKKGRVMQPKEGEGGEDNEQVRLKSVTIHANPFAH
ncbi:Peptidyl-prolyl cis-trans isomerase cyp10 [Ascosphaera aggregata]|nr:Peptidyl-prolyl cis-trans isomerase cyp10 [Ascosphaera aggregata]